MTYGLGGLPLRVKGCNYVPAKCYVSPSNLAKMWTSFDGEEIEREIDLIEDLGVNAVRFFLPYSQFWNFDNERKDQMDFVLGLLEARSMLAVPTLFTYAGLDWTKPENTFPYLERQILAYKDRAVIFGWDYANELDNGYCPDGVLNTEQKPVGKKTKPYYQIFVDWGTAVYNKIKELDPVHPVWAGSYGWDIRLQRPDIGMRGDFISIHHYDSPGELHRLINKAIDRYNAISVPTPPIMLGEVGYPTFGLHEKGGGVPDDSAAIANYTGWNMELDTWKGIAEIYPFAWSSFDYRLETSPNPLSVENYFGLYDSNYNIKKVGEIFKRWR